MQAGAGLATKVMVLYNGSVAVVHIRNKSIAKPILKLSLFSRKNKLECYFPKCHFCFPIGEPRLSYLKLQSPNSK